MMATLNPVRDNTLIESATGALSNGAGPNLFAGRTGQPAGTSLRRGLLAFDTNGGGAAIPAGATITSVSLRLFLNQVPSVPSVQNFGLRRVLANWGEGTSNSGQSGSGAASTAGDATWLHTLYNPADPSANRWASAGGDLFAVASATADIGDTVGFYTFNSSAALVADVQAWVNDPAANFGWALVGGEGTASTARRFDSRESVTAGRRPLLSIEYTVAAVPEPGTFALFAAAGAGGLVALTVRRRRRL